MALIQARLPRGQKSRPAVKLIAGLFLSGFLDRSFAIMNIKQEVRGLLVKEQDGGVANMSINRCHKHGLSIDTMWDDLNPQAQWELNFINILILIKR